MGSKKRIILIVLIICITNSLSVLAEIPKGTVIIGNRGYSLEYVNDEKNRDEIQRYIIDAKECDHEIFIKDNRGEWYKNSTGMKASEDMLPWVIYRKDWRVYQLFQKGDGEKREIGNFFEEDGTEIYEIHTKDDIYLREKEMLFKDCSVEGTIFIDAGKDGNVVLEDVKAEKIRILASGLQRIELSNVEVDELIIDGISKTTVVLKRKTGINRTTIMSQASIEAQWGDFGEIEIAMNREEKNKDIEIIGKLTEKVIIKSEVELNISKSCDLEMVEIEAENKEEIITLKGEIDNIKVNKESKINLSGAEVEKIVANSDLRLDIDEKSTVLGIKENDHEVVIERGKERVGEYSPYHNQDKGKDGTSFEHGEPAAFYRDGYLLLLKGYMIESKSIESYHFDTTPSDVEWRSDDPSIIRIEEGKIIGLQLGTTNMTLDVTIEGKNETHVILVKVLTKILDHMMDY